jgi:hypothetical protein
MYDARAGMQIAQLGLEDAFECVMNLLENDRITPKVAAYIRALWDCTIFQAIWVRRAQFQVVDSHKVGEACT